MPPWLVQRPPLGRHQCSSRCRVCRRYGQPAEPPPWHSPSTGKEETGYRVACPTPQASPTKSHSSPRYVPELRKTSSRLPEPREPPLNPQILSLLLPPLKPGPRNGILGPNLAHPRVVCIPPGPVMRKGVGWSEAGEAQNRVCLQWRENDLMLSGLFGVLQALALPPQGRRDLSIHTAGRTQAPGMRSTVPDSAHKKLLPLWVGINFFLTFFGHKLSWQWGSVGSMGGSMRASNGPCGMWRSVGHH